MAKKVHNTYEVFLNFPKADHGKSEILKDILKSLGIRQEAIIEMSKGNSTYLLFYMKTSQQAQRIKRQIQNVGLRGVDIGTKTLVQRDWQTKWKDDFKPFKLSENFDVVPSWLINSHKSKKREPIYIDTSFAFGTGLHATTRFMVGFIDQNRGKFDTFLDIGTGTGILAIAALKCGAKEIKAMDLKQDIIKITKENLKVNGFKTTGVQAIDFTKYKPTKKYDFVAANLITQDLITFKKKILQCVKPGKYLAVSGISFNSFPEFDECFKKLPLKCLKRERDEGWVGVLYKRTT